MCHSSPAADSTCTSMAYHEPTAVGAYCGTLTAAWHMYVWWFCRAQHATLQCLAAIRSPLPLASKDVACPVPALSAPSNPSPMPHPWLTQPRYQRQVSKLVYLYASTLIARCTADAASADKLLWVPRYLVHLPQDQREDLLQQLLFTAGSYLDDEQCLHMMHELIQVRWYHRPLPVVPLVSYWQCCASGPVVVDGALYCAYFLCRQVPADGGMVHHRGSANWHTCGVLGTRNTILSPGIPIVMFMSWFGCVLQVLDQWHVRQDQLRQLLKAGGMPGLGDMLLVRDQEGSEVAGLRSHLYGDLR